MKVAILGDIGRDVATVDRLEGHELHVIGRRQNPDLVQAAQAFYPIDRITNVTYVADIVEAIQPDMFFTHFEDSLAAGVVDVIKQSIADGRISRDLLIPCPDRAAAKIEWDKWELRRIIDEIDSKYNPINRMVSNMEEAREALTFYKQMDMEVALKPRNPAGGKGVKVMGEHLRSYGDDDPTDERLSAWDYAWQVLHDPDQTGLEIQQKFDKNTCHEFTLQILTDGNVMIRPSATYDYPYREDGDTGPGTGSTGSFTMSAGEQLPFINDDDYEEAMNLMADILEKLKAEGIEYKGVLYPTFFKTPEGLKIVEINARGGEPELINILDLMDDSVNYGEVLTQIALGGLTQNSVRYRPLASAVVELFVPEYGYPQDGCGSVPPYEFNMNPALVRANGCKIRSAAVEKLHGYTYRTVGTSRTVGICALAATPWQARTKIHDAIAVGFKHPLPLQYRRDVADETYIMNLAT